VFKRPKYFWVNCRRDGFGGYPPLHKSFPQLTLKIYEKQSKMQTLLHFDFIVAGGPELNIY